MIVQNKNNLNLIFTNIFYLLILFSSIITTIFSRYVHVVGISFWKEIIFFVIFVLYLIYLYKQQKFRRRYIEISLVTMIIIIQLIVSKYNNVGLIQNILGYKIIIFYIPLFFIYKQDDYNLEYIINNLLKIISSASIIMFIYGILQIKMGYFTLLGFYGEQMAGFTNNSILRVFSTTASPFEYAYFCYLMVLLCWAYILFKNPKKFIMYILFTINMIGIIISNVRQSLLDVIIGLILITLFKIFKSNRLKKMIFILGPLLGFIIFNYLINFSMNYYGNNNFIKSIITSNSLNARQVLWENAFQQFSINNIFTQLFGFGVGAVGAAQKLMMNFSGNYIEFNTIDNLYLYLYMNLGIIGVLIFIIFIFKTIFKVINSINNNNMYNYILMVTYVLCFNLFIGGYFRTIIEGLIMQVTLWSFMGIASRITKMKEELS
jgi:O-antigen ligase